MKKLNAAQKRELASLVQSMNEHQDSVDTAFIKCMEAYNELVGEIEQYNEAVDEATTFRDMIVEEMENYVSERSEKWQEGEAAQAYEEWASQWRDIDLEPLGIPEEPAEIEMNHPDVLADLPGEPE
jgi:uncharacterized coiled-coil DUF342 family protein